MDILSLSTIVGTLLLLLFIVAPHSTTLLNGNYDVVEKIAGGGAGNSGLASKARLLQPGGMSLINNGVLVADYNNNQIRRIYESGTEEKIAAYAGSGMRGDFGDGINATSAKLGGIYPYIYIYIYIYIYVCVCIYI